MKNINTQSHWNPIWQREGKDTWRTYPTTFSFVLNWIKDGSNLIDFGCGNGAFLKLVQEKKKGMTLMGLDISTIGISQLKEFYGIDGIVSKLPEIPYPLQDNQFDYVTAFDVMEHITEEKETINSAFRILKPNGWFIIAVPTASKQISDIKQQTSKKKKKVHEHVRNYTEESAHQMLSLYGRNVEVIGKQEEGSVFQGKSGYGRGFLWIGRSQK